MNFGDRLKEARIDKHLRQSDLGKIVGVSGQVISNLERSYTTGFSPEMLKKLANALDVSAEYLTGNNGYERPDPYELNGRDKYDISKDLDKMRLKIKNHENSQLNYDGIEVTEDDAELLMDAIELALKRIKKKNKEKYTPNKYKNNLSDSDKPQKEE